MKNLHDIIKKIWRNFQWFLMKKVAFRTNEQRKSFQDYCDEQT